MSQVKCYALAAEQQLAMQDALEKDDRTKFLEALNSRSINNMVTYSDGGATMVAGYITLLQKAIAKWILDIKEEK